MKKHCCILIFSFACASFIFAHAMFLDLIEPGVFQVEYDGGGFTPGTVVTLYSDAGFTEIESGVVDENGLYKFDPTLKPMTAEASDGAGHKAYWDAPPEGTTQTAETTTGSSTNTGRKKVKRPNKLPIVLTVLNTFAIIFLFFEFRSFKKKQKKSE